jgi:transcriptional regulator with XRE-family HTH domain
VVNAELKARLLVRTHLRMMLAANQWSIEDAAQRSGVAASTLYRIEATENTSLDTLARLVDGLGYDLHVTITRRP